MKLILFKSKSNFRSKRFESFENQKWISLQISLRSKCLQSANFQHRKSETETCQSSHFLVKDWSVYKFQYGQYQKINSITSLEYKYFQHLYFISFEL